MPCIVIHAPVRWVRSHNGFSSGSQRRPPPPRSVMCSASQLICQCCVGCGVHCSAKIIGGEDTIFLPGVVRISQWSPQHLELTGGITPNVLTTTACMVVIPCERLLLLSCHVVGVSCRLVPCHRCIVSRHVSPRWRVVSSSWVVLVCRRTPPAHALRSVCEGTPCPLQWASRRRPVPMRLRRACGAEP